MADAALNWSPFGDSRKDLPMTRSGTTVAIAETPSTFVLQGDDGDSAFLRAAEETLGFPLPKAVGEVSRVDMHRAFWLGPDMWLVLGASSGALPMAQSMSVLCTRFLHASVVETTEIRAWIRLEGPSARQTLMKLTARDLGDKAFPVGACAGALLGPLHALLERVEEDAYLIAGPTSSAEFLAEMMRDALAFV